MKGVITDTALPLGTTAPGSAWCTKCLHPSDLEMPQAGIPDHKTQPTAVLHYDVKYKINAPTPVGADTTWNTDILVRPDPLCFGAFYRCSASEFAEPIVRRETLTTGVARYFLNTQVSGTGATPELAYAAKHTFWRNNVRMFRPIYCGATLSLDAPALSDQGTISAAQYPVFSKPYSVALVDYTAPANTYIGRNVSVFESTFPSFDALQNMPGVYTAKAKDGCYMPLKFNVGDFNFKEAGASTYSRSDLSNGVVTDKEIYVSANTGYSNPWVPVADLYVNDATGAPTGDLALAYSTNNQGQIAVRGISNSAALYVQFRVGYEVMVMPGSTYSPNLQKLLSGDQTAMNSYFEISRRLADAYPESYNSLGAILPLIANVASKVVPLVAPFAGKALKGMGRLVQEAGMSEEQKTEKTNRRVAKKKLKALRS